MCYLELFFCSELAAVVWLTTCRPAPRAHLATVSEDVGQAAAELGAHVDGAGRRYGARCYGKEE